MAVIVVLFGACAVMSLIAGAYEAILHTGRRLPAMVPFWYGTALLFAMAATALANPASPYTREVVVGLLILGTALLLLSGILTIRHRLHRP